MAAADEPTFAEICEGLWDATDGADVEPVIVNATCCEHGRRLTTRLREDSEVYYACPMEGCAVRIFLHIEEALLEGAE